MNNQINEKDLRNPEYRGFWNDIEPGKQQKAKSVTGKPQGQKGRSA